MRFSQIATGFAYWVLTILVATVYEFAVRVIVIHKSWTLSTTIEHFVPNLLAVIVVAVVSGLAYGILLLVFRRRTTWLMPSAAAALAAFAAIPAAYYAHTFAGAKPEWILWLVSFGTGLILYLLIFLVLRKLIRPRQSRLTSSRVALFVILLPLLILAGTHVYRAARSPEASIGSIRHIVLISIDTLRYDYVSAYDARHVQTPTLDQIAHEGARFEVAISPVPQTGPSHISMFTGLSPLDHGIFLNGQQLPVRAKTIAHQLRDAGFRTAGFVSGFPLKDFNCNLQTGFNKYDDTMAFNDLFRDVFYGRLLGTLPFFRYGVYRQAHEVTEPALTWLEKNAAKPFFLFLHYYDPHYPYGIKPQRRRFKRPMFVPIPRSDVVNQKRLYAGEVRAVDLQIKRVVDFLKKEGIYDRTLLIVTADHGESLDEHDFFYSHERYIYEQMIRVPLIVRSPALVQPRTVFQKQVAMLDVYKTIASAAGVPPLPGDRGFDLIQLLKGDPARYDRMIPSFHFKYKVEGIRSDRWKLIHNGKAKKKKFELYDLLTDPGETSNRFASEQEIANSLMKHLSFVKAPEINGNDLTKEQIEVLRSLGYIQ
jgi:arylsulfatase A-like enzyme